MCYEKGVKLHLTISRLVAALTVLGLLLSPLAQPVTAAPVTAAADRVSMEMPADMPCCPEQAPAKDCTRDCPLAATCMAGGLQAIPPSARLFVPAESAGLLLSGNEAALPGLSTGPPQRPPKT